ncbi:MAG: OsmC family protein [Flavobacteriia bacterium]|nr:OsmC family protein [Flavobacteriia bacterium]
MSLELSRIDAPFVFELKNDDGVICGIDASPSIGGKNKGLRPMELLAGSLAGCASIDILLILKKQKIEPIHFSIKIESKRASGIPAIFEEIKLIFNINKEVPQEKLDRAIGLTLEKYCSVSASLKENIQILYEINYI